MIRILLFCSVGAAALFVGDLLHCQTDTAIYFGELGPRIMDVPIWVYAQFWLALFTLVITYPLRKQIFGFTAPESNANLIYPSLIWTLAIYLSTSISEDYYLIKNVLVVAMVVIQAITLKMFHLRSILDLLFVALMGCSVEVTYGLLHVFVYLHSPSIVGNIPFWLPLIYFSAGMTGRLAGRVYLDD